jgi:chromosome segregation ATPase
VDPNFQETLKKVNTALTEYFQQQEKIATLQRERDAACQQLRTAEKKAADLDAVIEHLNRQTSAQQAEMARLNVEYQKLRAELVRTREELAEVRVKKSLHRKKPK